MLGFTTLRPISGFANMALGFAGLGLCFLNCLFLYRALSTAKNGRNALARTIVAGYFCLLGTGGLFGKVTDGDLEIDNTRYKDGLALTTNATIQKSWTACDRVFIPEVAGQRLVKIENDNGEYALSDCKILNSNQLQVTIDKKDTASELLLRTIDLSDLKSTHLSIADLLTLRNR